MKLRRLGIGVIVIAICIVATLAIPVETWRTGRTAVPALTFVPSDALPIPARRVWIDTDAACGHGRRTDVDDCFALWLLAHSAKLEIAGVSTVFGNAPLDVTDDTTRQLARLLSSERGRSIRVSRGASQAIGLSTSRATPARDGLIRALEEGPLTILALGPATNVAHALETRPDLQANVAAYLAVMGRRMGHLFHPTEGHSGATLLGHGPVFRDFNFTADPRAVRALAAMGLPTMLVPYDAARFVEITSADLRRFAAQGTAAAWIARRSHAWAEYWRTDIGRPGFYPFDLLAAVYVRAPRLFRCADVRMWVGQDPMRFVPFLWPDALLVDQRSSSTAPTDAGSAVYCPKVAPGLESTLRRWLLAANRDERHSTQYGTVVGGASSLRVKRLVLSTPPHPARARDRNPTNGDVLAPPL